MSKVLVGNSFPQSLVRRKVSMRPASVEEARNIIASYGYLSYWGHQNTLKVASDFIGFDLTPEMERPAIELNGSKMPTLYGHVSDTVILVSPDYVAGYRPALGSHEEVSSDKIVGWQIVIMEW